VNHTHERSLASLGQAEAEAVGVSRLAGRAVHVRGAAGRPDVTCGAVRRAEMRTFLLLNAFRDNKRDSDDRRIMALTVGTDSPVTALIKDNYSIQVR